jgi:hypothetical protein
MGWLIAAVAVVVGGAAAAKVALPELQRYLKIRKM